MEVYNPEFISILPYYRRSSLSRAIDHLDYHVDTESHSRKMHIFKKLGIQFYQLPEGLK